MSNGRADHQGPFVVSFIIMRVLLMFSSFSSKDVGLLVAPWCLDRALHRQEENGVLTVALPPTCKRTWTSHITSALTFRVKYDLGSVD